MTHEDVRVEILLSDARGIYIPRDFLDFENRCDEDGKPLGDTLKEDLATLKDPDDEWYWEAWDNVLAHVHLHDGKGNVYFLYQNGDLFAISLEDHESLSEDERDKFWENYNY